MNVLGHLIQMVDFVHQVIHVALLWNYVINIHLKLLYLLVLGIHLLIEHANHLVQLHYFLLEFLIHKSVIFDISLVMCGLVSYHIWDLVQTLLKLTQSLFKTPYFMTKICLNIDLDVFKHLIILLCFTNNFLDFNALVS